MAEWSAVAAEKENVVKENVVNCGQCSVTILPQFGGKIASIRVRGRELLQAPLAPVAPRTHTMPFDAGDASGWDECLPSVAACTVPTAAGPVEVPDHGDLWRIEWSEQELGTKGLGTREQGTGNGQAACITLRGECFSLPLVLERTLALAETARGWQLRLNYKLTNRGRHPAPWSWAAHPLFAVEAGDEIQLPSSIKRLRVEGSGDGRLGKAGDWIDWPVAALAGGGQTDLSVAQATESGIGDKLFAGPLGVDENWCELLRPSAGVRVRFEFDPAATPYLGLWLCYGGWPDRRGPKQTCVALEPATAPVDSLAAAGEWSRTLLPGQSYSWPMQVDIEVI